MLVRNLLFIPKFKFLSKYFISEYEIKNVVIKKTFFLNVCIEMKKKFYKTSIYKIINTFQKSNVCILNKL